MGGIMIFWGLGDGVVNGPCQALFADSTPSGTRSTYFTYQFVCYLSASAVGPLVSIILFQTLGDNWDMYHLRIVIYVGLILETGNAILMMLFDDNKALDEDENDNDENEDENGNDEGGSNDEDGRRNGDGHEDEEQQAAPAPVSLLSSSNDNNNATTTITATAVAAATDSIRLKKRQEWIPYIVFISGLISSLGSGMTVKFFPLFFKDEIGMTPSQVQIIYVLVPLGKFDGCVYLSDV
jgi:MFS family permease